jgi:hypothetical protein
LRGLNLVRPRAQLRRLQLGLQLGDASLVAFVRGTGLVHRLAARGASFDQLLASF